MRRPIKKYEYYLILLICVVGAFFWFNLALNLFFPSAKLTKKIGTYISTMTNEYTATDVYGNEVTQNSFPGKYQLVYFGYTACPDVCPNTLGKIGVILDELGEQADLIAPVFITIDPEQDKSEVLEKYMRQFSDQITALVPTESQINTLTHHYKLVVQRTDECIDESDSCQFIDHTSLLYFFEPEGKLVAFFGADQPIEEIMPKIREALAQQKP